MSEDEDEFFDAEESESRIVWSRRNRLPVPMGTRALNIWSFLKSCIGKELTKVTMPIHFNEPLSFLQRITEYAEYFSLVEQAIAADDPILRLELVTAFAVSAAASNWDRLGKPFNPLLGETYEFQCGDNKIVCEQVSHHPPISAFYAEGKGYKFYGNIWPKLSFWGKTAEVQPRGVVTLELLQRKEVYTWQNVECYIHNIIIGKLWVEHKGKMRVSNDTTGYYVDLLWRPASWFKNTQQRVEGYMYSPKGDKVRAMYGKWTEAMFSVSVEAWKKYMGEDKKKNKENEAADDDLSQDEPAPVDETTSGDQLDENEEDPRPQSSNSPCDLMLPGQRLLWQVTPRSADSAQYYNFTTFAMRLNEMTEELFDANLLPPTDCRYRPDMRLMERGEMDKASEEKHRLEEKQRERRRIFEAAGKASEKESASGSGKEKLSSKLNPFKKPSSSSNMENENLQPYEPLWFKPSSRHNVKKQQYEWLFTGKYFARDWSKCPDIY